MPFGCVWWGMVDSLSCGKANPLRSEEKLPCFLWGESEREISEAPPVADKASWFQGNGAICAAKSGANCLP